MIWTHANNLIHKHCVDHVMMDEYNRHLYTEGNVVVIAPEVFGDAQVYRITSDALRQGYKVLYATYKGWKYKDSYKYEGNVYTVVHDEQLADPTHLYIPLAIDAYEYSRPFKRYDVFLGGRKAREFEPVLQTISNLGLSAVVVSDRLPPNVLSTSTVKVIPHRVPLAEYMSYLSQSRLCCIPLSVQHSEARGHTDVARAILTETMPVATRDCTCNSTAQYFAIDNSIKSWEYAVKVALQGQHQLQNESSFWSGLKSTHNPQTYLRKLFQTIDKLNNKAI